MVSTHKFEAECEVKFRFAGLADGEHEVAYPKVLIEYSYKRGSPAVIYQRNGDPGWPAESSEIEVLSAKLVNGDGLNPTQAQIDDWAQDWIDSDSGYQMACDNAEDDLHGDPDAAYERKRDMA